MYIKTPSPKCPMCNKLVTKLVSMQDNGKGQLACVKCKRAIKKGKTIKQWAKKDVCTK